MPFTRITSNFKFADREAFVADFHQVLKSVLGIPDYDRLVSIDEKVNGFYQPTDTQGPYLFFEVSLFVGRSIDIKRLLYSEMIQLCNRYGVKASNFRLVLNEQPKENWAVRGGQAGCDIILGYRTDV